LVGLESSFTMDEINCFDPKTEKFKPLPLTKGRGWRGVLYLVKF
jgi:hypothetical protein